MKKIVKNPLVILGVAGLLLLGSGVGATRAAIVYQMEEDRVSFSTAEIGVAILENDVEVEDVDGNKALTFGLKKDETFSIGKNYDEVITVVNNSSKEYGYDEYVRVIITKSWFDTATNKKATWLSPELIELNVINDPDWIFDEQNSTREQLIYYYAMPLAQGAAVDLTDKLCVSDKVTTTVTAKDKNGKELDSLVGITGNITTTYDYDNMSFYIDVEADAVQTHSAAAAIKGAWGVDVNVDAATGRLSLVKERGNE